MMYLTDEIKERIRIPYGLRRVPASNFATLLGVPDSPQPGDIALARLEKIGRNTRLELISGRACNLHEGDLLAVVFGNRYATEQFEGYARVVGNGCDLLSMGGLCGCMESKHASMAEPSKLCLLGALGDENGRPLRLRDFALAPLAAINSPRIIVVCGTSMDSGKTHTAMSLVVGLRKQTRRVASIKLTGTVAGRDTWNMIDAGANPAYDFVDGGFPSTYLCTVDELLNLYHLLVAHAALRNAAWVVIEIADGLLQKETAALLQDARFTSTVNKWVFAASDPISAVGGVQILRAWDVEPIAISGQLSMSPLGIREAKAATGVKCLTAREIQNGGLNESLTQTVIGPPQDELTRNIQLEVRAA